MANEEQLSILKQGVEVWNKWRENNHGLDIDLTEADLSKMDLRYCNFTSADLRLANVNGADLSFAHFIMANLLGVDLKRAKMFGAILLEAKVSQNEFVDADMRGVDLYKADLRYSDLRGANLEMTDLRFANLRNANLCSANLKYALMGNTILFDSNLLDAQGLETVRHESPSLISLESLHVSKGNLPLSFLRGCGLRDLDIEYAKLANPGLDPEQVIGITYKMHEVYFGGALKYYSCFISYNRKDEEFAMKLHDNLQDNGVRCWFAPEDMKIGDQIRPRIDQEIRLRDKLLVLLSENSIRSEWVGDEVEAALEEENKSNRLILFPIRLDDTVLNTRDDWAAKIKRRRHIGNFSNWNDKVSYQKAFDRLLRDLKATD